MAKETINVVLGCFGLRDGEFISCPSVENKILEINECLNDYDGVTEYWDNCRLFDRALFDINAIRHFIFNVRDRFQQPTRRLWSEKQFRLFEKFIINHRLCGLYLKLTLSNIDQSDEEKEGMNGIFIKGSKDEEKEEVESGLVIKLLRK